MSKRRMADVVDQSQRLNQIDIQVECRGDGARDLCHFHGVGQASTEMVGVAAGEDLRLVFQPAKGAGMDYAIAVPLKRIAIGVRRLGIAASTRILNANSVAGQHRRSLEQFHFWCIGGSGADLNSSTDGVNLGHGTPYSK